MNVRFPNLKAMQISKPTLLHAIFLLLVSVFIASFLLKPSQNSNQIPHTMEEVEVKVAAPSPSFTEIHGVKIEKKPPQSKLDQLAVSNWPTWKGEPGKMPWTFSGEETMYLLEGKVKVTVDGHEDECFEVEAGDLAVFPKGMKITWDVLEAVNKHYSFKE